MKRKPSIHVSRDSLIYLIDSWFEIHQIGKPAELLADHLLKFGKSMSLRHRSLLADTEKTQRRASRIEASPRMDASKLAALSRMIRGKAGHRNLKIITEKDGAQWDFLLQATGLANDFVNQYNLKKDKGYIIYLQIAMKELKGNFAFNRIKSAHERITAHYECIQEIEKDPNTDKTELIYDLYQQRLFEKTGINMPYRDFPYEYVHFVRASQCSIDVGLHPKHYVSAQFDQLDFTNGYPTPNQLATFKAKERAIRWATENDIVKREKQKNLNAEQIKFMKKHANPGKQ